MAENNVIERHYTITIKNSNGGSGGISPVAGSNTQTNESKGSFWKNGLLQGEARTAAIKGYAVYRTVKSFASQVITHEDSMVQLRTGSNSLQEQANWHAKVRSTAVGILESAAMGAMVFGFAGMVLGATLSAAHKLINIQQNRDRLNTERNVENVGLQMQNIRAGANGSRHI